LPEYMVPNMFVLLPELPLNANGKVDRKKLPEPESRSSAGSGQHVAARTELEQTLAAAWQEVLGVERIGINDNFFEAGGSSLLVLKLRRGLERKLSRSIAVADLFQYPTIKYFAEYLDKSDMPARFEEAEDRAKVRYKLARQRQQSLLTT
jgi:phosphopantetheine binding protein